MTAVAPAARARDKGRPICGVERRKGLSNVLKILDSLNRAGHQAAPRVIVADRKPLRLLQPWRLLDKVPQRLNRHQVFGVGPKYPAVAAFASDGSRARVRGHDRNPQPVSHRQKRKCFDGARAEDAGHLILLDELGRLRHRGLRVEQALLDDKLYRPIENSTVHLGRRLDAGEYIVANGFGWAASDRQNADLDGLLGDGRTARAQAEERYEPTEKGRLQSPHIRSPKSRGLILQ